MSKFRLHRIGWVDGAREEVTIELGLTGYKEYVGTNQLPDAQRAVLEADGARVHGDAAAHLSNALGCETVLLTADAQVVLLRRSRMVSSGEGLYNGPSGHAEPSHAGIAAHGVLASGSAASDAALVELARAELFDAMRQEVHEETNVPLDALSQPLLIGASCDSAHKPDVLFLTTTTLDAAGVRATYAAGAAEGWESDRLAFWPAERLAACADEMPLTSVTRAAVACFALVR